jgi:hypothetical protein
MVGKDLATVGELSRVTPPTKTQAAVPDETLAHDE